MNQSMPADALITPQIHADLRLAWNLLEQAGHKEAAERVFNFLTSGNRAKAGQGLLHPPTHVLDGCGLSYEQCAEIAKEYGLENAAAVDLIVKAAFRVAARDRAAGEGTARA